VDPGAKGDTVLLSLANEPVPTRLFCFGLLPTLRRDTGTPVRMEGRTHVVLISGRTAAESRGNGVKRLETGADCDVDERVR